jgi:pseudaminic acid biosynthesis-associated methylase
MSSSAIEGDPLSAWRGEFGDAYTSRNEASPAQVRARIALWSNILRGTHGEPPRSFVEIGANIGSNLRALRALTEAELFAVEPNDRARSRLIADGIVVAENVRGSAAESIDFPENLADLAFTSGVLIHIPPVNLPRACREIHRLARRYVVAIEYFSDREQEVPYRGRSGLLFKRDFGDFYMTQHPDLRLVDYGFAWKRATGLDNLTWWLFRKT